MKRLFILLLALAGVLAGCGREAAVEGLPLPQGIRLLETDRGAWLFQFAYSDNGCCEILYHIPAGTDIPIPLCKREGCAHNSEACDAATVSSRGVENAVYCNKVGCFRDRLYGVTLLPDDRIGVVSFDPVSWARREEYSVDVSAAYGRALDVSVQALFHENTLVLVCRGDSAEPGPVCRVVAVDLPTGKTRCLGNDHFDRHFGNEYVTTVGTPAAAGNKLYFSETGYEEQPDMNVPVVVECLVEMDLTTGETRQLAANVGVSECWVENGVVSFLDQEQMCFTEVDLQTGEVRRIDGVDMTGTASYADGLIVRDWMPEYTWEELNDPDFREQRYYDLYTMDYQYLGTVDAQDWSLLYAANEKLYFWHEGAQYALDLNGELLPTLCQSGGQSS